MTRYAPLWQQAGSYPAGVDRGLIATLWPASGSTGGAATAVTNTMNVSVAAGTAAVALSGGNGSVLCRWDAAEVVTLAAAPPAGQSRIDLIVLQVRDNALDGGGNNDFIVQAIAGVPTTGTPAAPAVPSNAYALAQLTVPGGTANLNGVTVVDRRGVLNPRDTVHTRVSRASVYTSSTSGAPVPYDTVDYDALGLYNIAGQYFRCPVAGVYHVSATTYLTPTGANQVIQTSVRRNGVSVGVDQIEVSTTSFSQAVKTAQSVACAAGDQLQVFVSTAVAMSSSFNDRTTNWACFDYLGTG